MRPTSPQPIPLLTPGATRSTVMADSPAGRAALALAATGRVTVTRSTRHGVIVLEVIRR